MKKLIFFLVMLLVSLITYSQTTSNVVTANTVQAKQHMVAPTDTVLSPKYLGEIRRRTQDSTLYVAIKLSGTPKWTSLIRNTDLFLLSPSDTTGIDMLYSSGNQVFVKDLFPGTNINFTLGVKGIQINSTSVSSGVSIGDPITGGTANSILFLGAGGKFSQKNSDFYYDSLGRYMYISNTTGPAGIRLKTTNGGGFLELRMDNDFGGDYIALRNMANSDNGKFHIVTTGTNRFTVQQNGNVGVGTSSPSTLFHVIGNTRLDGMNNATSSDTRLLVKGASDSVIRQLNFTITQGPYTPTKTDVANIATSSVTTCHYERSGDYIEVFGEITIDPTATGATQVDLSLPIPSIIGNTYDLSGTAATGDSNQSIRIYGDVTNARAIFSYTAIDASSHVYSFRFKYKYVAP